MRSGTLAVGLSACSSIREGRSYQHTPRSLAQAFWMAGPLQRSRPMRTELTKLYDMIDDLDTAMLTTRRSDGHLVSRAMANQKHAPGADLWFVTSDTTHKLDELATDPHVNVAYFKDRTREWISVAGLAK